MTEGRVIGLISGKGGVGKTSLSVNLSIALRQLGKEVTVIDADFSASNLGVHLGRYEHPVKIQHVLRGEDDPASAVFRHPTGIKAVAASNEIHEVEPDHSNMDMIVEYARQQSDYVLLDCPPGLDETVEGIMDSCDELLIVTMPTQTSGINAAQIIEKAKQMRVPILGTVINKSEGDSEMELVDREVEMMTESHIMGTVPYDREMKRSLFEGQPLMLKEPTSDAAIEIQRLAHNLEGQEFEEPRFAGLKRKFRNLKSSLMR